MKSVTFFVPGRPRGKGRPRFTKQGRAYTPKATKQYEQKIRAAYMEQCGEKSFGSLPVAVKIVAYFPIPKGARKSDKAAMAAGLRLPTGKPDVDNVAKAVLDAVQGEDLAFDDDRQVVRLTIAKRYTTGEGGLEVTITDYTP